MAETELLTDQVHSRRDMAMVDRAIRNGWIFPEIPTAAGTVSILEALPKKLATIALTGKNERAVVSASKLLMEMKLANDRAEGTDRPPINQPSPQINVGVRIDNHAADTGRGLANQIVERIRAERLSGDGAG